MDERQPNPDFDHGRVVWSDAFSGEYGPVEYESQFDDQWRLFLEGKQGFHDHTGVETSDPWIDGRIYELTGVADFLERRKHSALGYQLHRIARACSGALGRRSIGGRLHLEPKFPIDFFEGKRCLDLGCGAGRWTRTLMTLGGVVKSCDVSEHGLASTRRFNDDVEYLNLFDILGKRSDLQGMFDFTLCWGVMMCTHDPRLAFENVSSTVRSGGSLYTMVYSPTYHSSDKIRAKRKRYHREIEPEKRLEYAYEITKDPRNTINTLDMLNTFYNWTIPEEVVHEWYHRHGFKDVVTLNAKEASPSAYHVLGTKG